MEANTGQKNILVPWGLTMMSETAFEFAVDISNGCECGITLGKVVKSENLISEALQDLNEVRHALEKKYSIKPNVVVTHGNILKKFSEMAVEHNCSLIIKHTSGVSGMEKIIGGKTIKIVAGSQVPYIIVQNSPRRPNIDKFVLPVDYTKESKEKMNWFSFLNRNFKLNPFVYLVSPNTTDDRKMRMIKNNLIFAKNILDDKGIQFEHHTIDSKIDFADGFVDFAHKVDADIILIMLPKDFGFSNVLFGSKEQDIIVNKHEIPVMCINPRDDLTLTGWK